MVTLEEEFTKNPDLKQEDLIVLKEWYNKQPHFPPHFTDERLALFLHSCYYDIDLAKVTIEKYLTLRTNYSNIFLDKDPVTTDIRDGQKISHFLMLPKLTPEGYSIINFHIEVYDASIFKFEETLQSLIITSDLYLHLTGTTAGWQLLIDMTGLSLGHLFKTYIPYVRVILSYLQEAIPLRLKGIHFVNVDSISDSFIGVCRPFLKKEVSQMLFLHTKLTTLQPHFPLDVLPVEYGGTVGSLADLRQISLKETQDYRDWFIQERQIKIDESKIPRSNSFFSKLKNIF